MSATTVSELLTGGAADAAAIGGIDAAAMTYAGLAAQAERVASALAAAGVRPNDRIAIVLPNGPEMATAFLCVACIATTAPLNPAYRTEEFAFYLEDLKACALLVEAGSDSPAVAAAVGLGVPVIELVPVKDGPAGAFDLRIPQLATPVAPARAPNADDIALVLHTSGTTSRPKIVPLSHGNVCASARNITATLSLAAGDRALNVMPLFHIHGLMAAILASLNAGASVVCTPGFDALRFFGWLDAASPTWYSAVPTMHQAILTRARRNKEIIARARLRFVRSSSSSLPPQVLQELEEAFGVRVVEAYAMTEAAHQMTSNQLPPGDRKPGTVGIASGPDVRIMSESDPTLLDVGETGEIVIRGDNVTTGYDSNPQANADNFVAGWFRTGDQGVMDDDGFLTITGRLKEIINRGGEKISPREVDDVLMDHPAVQQVVTFAMPHKSLGEDVACAVVLRDGADATERDLQDFVRERAAAFKVPRKVLFLDEIPKGATGKLQRIGLAEKLGIG